MSDRRRYRRRYRPLGGRGDMPPLSVVLAVAVASIALTLFFGVALYLTRAG